MNDARQSIPLRQTRATHVLTFLLTICLAVAGLSHSTTHAQESNPLVGLPLLAFYPFEDDANDASGNGRHGQPHNGVRLVDDGYEGQAYYFDGVNDYIRVGLNINPGPRPVLTMGAWVRATSHSRQVRQVISHDNGGFDRSLGMDYRNWDGKMRWSAFVGTGGVRSGPPVKDSEWVFLAVVYDQSARTVALYVNEQKFAKSGSLGQGWNALRIGSNPSFGEFFHGRIDNVFFINAALNDEQIDYIRLNGATALAAMGTGSTIAGTVTDQAGTPQVGASVQVCRADNLCSVVQTNGAGQYVASGLLAGDYRLTAFPPAGVNLLPASIGPISLASGRTLANQNIELGQVYVIMEDTSITNRRISPSGMPIVFWDEPLQLTTHGCPGGQATYSIYVPGYGPVTEQMFEGAAGEYTAWIPSLRPRHGYAIAVIDIICPDPSQNTSSQFNLYIDPSGVVVDTNGAPISGANVTLYRSDEEEGPFEIVPDGSVVMSPANRANPDTTDSAGHFGWDVLAGYYRVRAEADGCVSPADEAVNFVETEVMEIPPPRLDLVLTLLCALPPSADAGGPYTVDEGQSVTLNGSNSGGSGALTYAWDLDGDGVFETPGQTVSFTALDGDASLPIAMQVCDETGQCAIDSATIDVHNAPPAATAQANPMTVFRGETIALTASWSDPAGAADNPYTWAWDLDGDGAMDRTGVSNAGDVIEQNTAFALEGDYTLTFSVVDKDGGSGTSSVTVTVLNQPPDCSAAVPDVAVIWPPNHNFVPVQLVGVTDPEGDSLTLTVTGIFQDEPVNGNGDGDSGPDGRGVGTSNAEVRAERSGTKKEGGNGRVYAIGFQAADGHGGVCDGTVTVAVPHDQKKPAVNDGTVYDSTEAGEARAAQADEATGTLPSIFLPLVHNR